MMMPVLVHVRANGVISLIGPTRKIGWRKDRARPNAEMAALLDDSILPYGPSAQWSNGERIGPGLMQK
jgi:hypothetical protein